MGKRYNNILEIMGNTPVVKLNKLGPKGGPLVTAGQGAAIRLRHSSMRTTIDLRAAPCQPSPKAPLG